MRMIFAMRGDWAGCDELLGAFFKKNKMKAVVNNDGDSEFGRGETTFKLPRQRWWLPGALEAKSFNNLYRSGQLEDTVNDFVTSKHGNCAIAFIANGAHEVTEIVGCPNVARLSSPNTHKGIANSELLHLLAYHRSNTFLRGARKVDSVGTSAAYWAMIGPIMTPFWVTRGIKGGARTLVRKALGRHSNNTVNL